MCPNSIYFGLTVVPIVGHMVHTAHISAQRRGTNNSKAVQHELSGSGPSRGILYPKPSKLLKALDSKTRTRRLFGYVRNDLLTM